MEDTLASVLENRPNDCEVIVVLNHGYDDPYDLKDEVRFVEAPPGSRLVERVNLGFAVSRAPLVHLLCCGVLVDEGWVDVALERFRESAVAAVIPWVVEAGDPERIVAAGSTYQSWGRIRRLARRFSQRKKPPEDVLVDPVCPVAFYRKAPLATLGWFSDRAGQWLAGVDMSLALRRIGLRCVLEPQCRLRIVAAGDSMPGAYGSSWAAERLFWEWLPADNRFGCVALHGLLVAWECVSRLPRLASLTGLTGRMVGGLGMVFGGRRRLFSSTLPTVASQPAMVIEGPHFHLARECGRWTGDRQAKRVESGIAGD
jgi:hypothetical protein